MTREDITTTEAAIKNAEAQLKTLAALRDEMNADIAKNQRAINSVKRKLGRARKLVAVIELHDQLKQSIERKS